ncbi:MAG: hypothetical protein IJC45_03910 [Clostridia bacterium]|nr:hypothetical protein [Clostridia bacterium]
MKTKLDYGTFIQYDKKFLTAENGADVQNILSVGFLGETLYVAQKDGLFTYEDGKFTPVQARADKLFSRNEKLYAADANKLLQVLGNESLLLGTFDSPVQDVSIGVDGSFWVITQTALYLQNGKKFEQIVGIPEDTVCLCAKDNAGKYNETVFLGTLNEGLLSMKGKRRHWAELMTENTGVQSNHITCLATDALGHLWVGSKEGLNIYDGRSCWFNGNSLFAVPDGAFNAMCFTADGKKYFATDTGLILLSEGHISYFSYGAWLLHPTVTALAVSEKGTIAAVTPRGISLITATEMTLAEKAAHFDAMNEKYFMRNEGYQVCRALRKYGDLDSGWLPNSDNDGLFTGLYCASQCFRYAVTGDLKAKANAKRTVYAMMKLTQVTGKKGFTARATRYKGEPEFGTGNREEWHYCENDPDCEWLGETSSDEMTGHYFAYGIYFDLVADEEDKKCIAQTVREITDHILDNNFHLCDVDGIPTTWANWEPDLLNNDDRWYNERGTNSLEILSFLQTAHHVTGDEKYAKVFEMLISRHHYAMNCMQYKVEDAHVAHIDDQLDFVNIYPLLTYTENEAYKEIFKMGLTHHWAYERVERSPFFNVVYGALTSRNCDIENAAKSLAEMNMDTVRWPVFNSYRKDIVWDTEQEATGVPAQLKEPVEYGSRLAVHYDGNPFICDSGAEEFVHINSKIVNRTSTLPGTSGANGMCAMQPYVYLLPYWMARYHGLLE